MRLYFPLMLAINNPLYLNRHGTEKDTQRYTHNHKGINLIAMAILVKQATIQCIVYDPRST